MRLIVVLVGLSLLVSPMAVAAGSAVAPASASDTDVTLRVTVVNQQGDPLGNAEVTVSYDDQERTSETFATGEALFDVPEGATVEITPTHPMLVKNNPVTVENVQGTTDVTVTMYPSATGEISLVDGSGNAVSDADVQLRKDGRTVLADTGTTGSDGTYTTPALERGNYTVRITKPGYYEERRTVTLSGDTDVPVEVEQGSATVDFSVVDAHFEPTEPLQANIEIEDAGGTVGTFRTGSSGSRSVSLDVNTRYTVTVEKEGYETVSTTFRVGERDRSRTFAIVRTPRLTVEPMNSQVVVGQSLRVDVTNEYDEPAAGAEVRIDGEAVATTDESGTTTLTVEQTGEVELTAVNGSVESPGVIIEAFEPRTDAPTATATPNGTATPSTTATTQAQGTTEESDDGGTPGFGVAVALVALVIAALLARIQD
ncbi:carboxypeptidase regulatory-like domain-containing protein [Haloarchaeobius sp. FL176]|uniref:carboxypeptidase regulatory-like domain-containing protein n=1 Tax=Haloarchaeobius sp. FL176 TaxID=2967129 RepID=UPI002147A52B|nr:carboxypeptidase regulatory-like domain-containing protein [Haloarchaeobius sp. FL176]